MGLCWLDILSFEKNAKSVHFKFCECCVAVVLYSSRTNGSFISEEGGPSKGFSDENNMGSSINEVTQFLPIFDTTSTLVTLFITKVLVLSSQNLLPPSPSTVTSFMNDPKAVDP